MGKKPHQNKACVVANFLSLNFHSSSTCFVSVILESRKHSTNRSSQEACVLEGAEHAHTSSHTRAHTLTHPWGRLHDGKASVDLRRGCRAERPRGQEAQALNTRQRLCRNPVQSRPGGKSISSRRACGARRDRRQAGRPHPGPHGPQSGRWRGRSSGSLGQALTDLSGSHPSPSPVGSVWPAELSCVHKAHDCFAQRSLLASPGKLEGLATLNPRVMAGGGRARDPVAMREDQRAWLTTAPGPPAD